MPLSVSSVPGSMFPGLIWPAAPLMAGALLPVQTLTATPDVPDGAGMDLTALLTAPTSTLLQFSNSTAQRLYVISSAAGLTVQVNVGTTILGQSVASFPAVTLTSGHLYQFGRFHSLLDVPGSSTVTITLSTASNVLIALIQDTAVS